MSGRIARPLTVEQFIGVFCDPDRTHPKPHMEGVLLHFGCAPLYTDAYDMDQWIPPGFVEEERWSNGFRRVWQNSVLRTMITYCEGDIDVAVAETDTWFGVLYRDAQDFYEEVK